MKMKSTLLAFIRKQWTKTFGKYAIELLKYTTIEKEARHLKKNFVNYELYLIERNTALPEKLV